MQSSPLIKAAISSLIVVSLSTVQANESFESDRYTANLSGYLGHKTLDEGDWQSLDSQTAIGVLFDIRKQSWPVSIVFNVVGSGDVDKSGSLEAEGYTLEHRIGVRKTYDSEKIHRYYGGGIALVDAKIKNKDNGITTSEDDNSGIGYWLGAGLYYDISSQFILGFDVTYTNADVTLFNVDRKAGGIHSGITVGYHW